jgi:hypothetical protein
MSRFAALAALFAVAGCGGCHGTTAGDAGGTSGEATATAPTSVSTPVGTGTVHAALPCRAATVMGRVTLEPLSGFTGDAGGPALAGQSEIPADAWVDVSDAASRFTARSPKTTRETTFTGPGRSRPCVGDDEDGWLLGGTFASVPSSAERPGGEEWLMTPLAVVAYASAKMEAELTPTGITVRVGQGGVQVWTLDGTSASLLGGDAGTGAGPDAGPATGDGWTRVLPGTTWRLKLEKKGSPEDLAAAASEACAKDARDAHELGVRVAAKGAPLAEILPRHVRARRLARAACGAAAVRIEALALSATRDGLLERVRAADADWRSLASPPTAPTGGPPNPLVPP